MAMANVPPDRAAQLALPIKYVGITFLAAVLANVVVIAFLQDSPLLYLVVPFNLAYVLAVAWLAKQAYSWFMAIITVLLIVVPIGVLVVMILAYSRAANELKSLGYKSGFSGNLKPL